MVSSSDAGKGVHDACGLAKRKRVDTGVSKAWAEAFWKFLSPSEFVDAEIHAHPVSLLKDATRRPMLVGDKNPHSAGPCSPN